MKKRAFTLTELLVVVVIVGVLSAVVLPKFTKILQTRKTTEAENVMAAVRNEQEARCMVGRDYTADTTKLASLPKATSKNYTYTLDAQGITATAKDGNYTLQIPSYTDGRICCSGEGCDGLNKDYPLCGSISNLVEASCEAPIPQPCADGDCGPDPEPEPEPCNLTDYTRTCQEEGYSAEYTGSVTYTVNADCTGHTKTDTCTKQEPACTTGTNRLKEPYEECWEGCGEVWEACDSRHKWNSHCQAKEGTQCMPWSKDRVEKQTRNGVTVEVTYSCQSCKWVKTGEEESCPDNKVLVDGMCCLPGQIVKNGKCLYKYRPNRFAVNILVVCHSSSYGLTMDPSAIISEEQFNSGYMGYKYQYSSYAEYKEAIIRQNSGTQGRYGGGGMGNKPAYCYAMGYSYYRGGNIPWVNAGDGCDWHYANIASGNWWVGGTRVQGNQVYGSDQDWCDKTCGQQTSCDTKGIVDRGNPPGTCDSYHCSNGWHCDNAPGGTGVALECIREY